METMIEMILGYIIGDVVTLICTRLGVPGFAPVATNLARQTIKLVFNKETGQVMAQEKKGLTSTFRELTPEEFASLQSAGKGNR